MAEGGNAGYTKHQVSQVTVAGGNEGYKILLMNTNGPSLGRGTARRRQTAFKEIVDDLNPSIIFTQECNSKFRTCLERPEYVQYPRSKSEAGLIFNEHEFDRQLLTHHAFLLSTIRRLTNARLINKDFDFVGRAQVMRFTSWPGIQPALDVIAISWHGVHRCDEEKKIIYIDNFFTVVARLQNEWNLPVIIGGDFNLDRNRWPQRNDFRIPVYTNLRRLALGKPLIDHFVSTQGVTLTGLSCYDLGNIENATDLFDHDPIHAMIRHTR